MRSETTTERLTVAQFDSWNEELDEALAVLPEMANAPHELYRLIARSKNGPRKRFVLASHDGAPVAIVGLRQIRRHWEQLGCGSMPGTTLPAVPGYEMPALAATGLDVWMNLLDEPPAPHDGVRLSYSIPAYRMDCADDEEAYWRETGFLRFVKAARRTAKKYQVEVDAPGTAAWTVNGWARRWQNHETDVAPDQIIAADYYLAHGRYHTFRMTLNGETIAGYTLFVDNGRLTGQSTFFDEKYRSDGVGTFLLDYVFKWAREAGYRQIDLGGGHGYKAKWAPENGEIWTYNVCPQSVHLRRQAMQWVKRTGSRLISSSERTPGLPASSAGALAAVFFSAQDLL